MNTPHQNLEGARSVLPRNGRGAARVGIWLPQRSCRVVSLGARLLLSACGVFHPHKVDNSIKVAGQF